MANLLSPGVAVTTKDLSQVTVAAGDSAACFAGDFVKGPVNVPTLISSVQELKDTFGNPTKFNYNQWYQVFNFLQYSGSIYVVRAADLNGTPEQSNLSYNSNEFVASNIEKQIKDFDILNQEESTIEFRDGIEIEVGDTLRFNADSKTYRVKSADKVSVPVENPLFVPLCDLNVTIPEGEVEQGQTITYDYESDGNVSVTNEDGAEIDTTNKTIKFTKSGLVSITFTASKNNLRDKILQANFEVNKIAQPVVDTENITKELESGAKVEIEIQHEADTEIKAQIADDDGLKGKVNVK